MRPMKQTPARPRMRVWKGTGMDSSVTAVGLAEGRSGACSPSGRFRPLGSAGSLIKVILQFKLRCGLCIEGTHVSIVKVKGALYCNSISHVIIPTSISALIKELLLFVFLASSTFSICFSLSKNFCLARISFPGSSPV